MMSIEPVHGCKKTVAFDVDGCLIAASDEAIIAREKVRNLLALLSSCEDVIIVLWSGSGGDYARMVAVKCHVDQFVDRYAHKSEAPLIKADLTFDDQDVSLGKVNIRI